MKIKIFLSSLLFICLISVQTVSALNAKQKDSTSTGFKSLAFGTSFGIVADMSKLGSTIIDSGFINLNSDSLASNANISMLLMSDKDTALLKYSAEGTNATPLQIIGNYTEGGPLIGIDFGAYAWYDLLRHLNIPVFFRLGFDYAANISGGAQKLTLGPGPDQIALASGFPTPAGGFEGGTLRTTWGSSWIEIPFTVGVCWQIGNRAKIYCGIGISYFHGGWSVDIKGDAKYAAFLTSYKDDDDTALNEETLMMTEGFNEHIAFTTDVISVNMLMGFEVFVWRDLAVTVEYYIANTTKRIFANSELSSTGKELMTLAVEGTDTASEDSEYIKRLTHSTKVGDMFFQFGVKYYFDSLLF